MLTLNKTRDAIPIVPIVETNSKKNKPLAQVYFTHSYKDENKNIAPCFETLTLHKPHIKSVNQISEQEFKEICTMIDDSEEADASHPLRKAYWDVRERFETSLMREMYIGDQENAVFRWDFPTKMKDWPGTFTLFGSSGAGKTHTLVAMIENYFRRTQGAIQVRHVIWLSPEEKIDKTLLPLKKEKWRKYYTGIDISEKALKQSNLSAKEFFETKIASVIEQSGEDCILVLDDFKDSAVDLYPMLERLYNSSIRVARHRNTSVISLQHTYAGHRATSQSLQSNRFVIFFPRSQQQRCITFLKDHLGVPPAEAKVIVKRFASLDRSMTIHMHNPVCIFNKAYLLLI